MQWGSGVLTLYSRKIYDKPGMPPPLDDLEEAIGERRRG